MSTEYIERVLEKLKSTQTRKSTANNYLGIWCNFNNFLLRLEGKDKNASWEQKTVLFGTYLVDQGAQSQTVTSYFSAIKYILKTDGYPWNDSKAMLDVITKSCRIINDQVKIRLPIRVALLEQILFETECYFGSQPYLECMYKGIFSIAYYGLMRISEIAKGTHPVLAKDVHIGMNKNTILLRLHTSKTHGKELEPQEIRITQNVFAHLTCYAVTCTVEVDTYQMMSHFLYLQTAHQ